MFSQAAGTFLVLFGALAAQTAAAEQPGRQRPNIVFVFSDDHAYQAISAYGSAINQTPQIDRIAREGMRFEMCLVTNSICGPSRAAILTGKYSHLNGFYQNGDRFDGAQQTFPKLLQQAGYQTAMIGKWHLASDPTGFDHWLVLPGQGDYYNPDFRTPDGNVRLDGYVTDVITDRALDWLRRQRDQSRPFLLMLQHKAPHRAWRPGPDHLTLYDDRQIPEPATLFDDYQNRAPVLADQTMTIARHMRLGFDLKVWPGEDNEREENFFSRYTEEQKRNWKAAYDPKNQEMLHADLQGDDLVRWKYQRYIKDYLRCVASVDDNVGRVLDYLDESGLASNTVVVYSSDQGFYLGEHGWYDKRWIFDQSLRTPLLVRWPGVVQPGSRNKRMVSNLDFAQTFLDIVGAEVPPDMQGRSLLPLLRGEDPEDWRQAFYYHYYELGTHNVAAHYGVVTARYKLVHYYRELDENRQPRPIDQWDLMDRQADPREMHSYYGDPEYADVRAELAVQLSQLRSQLQVPEGK